MRPMPLKVLAGYIDLSTRYETLIHGIAIDSRLVKPGDLFFALPGKRTDGHHYLKQAISNGAHAAVVACGFQQKELNVPFLYVPDVTCALQLMAKKYLAERKTQVVAITGSHGKTTTKNFLATLLKKQFRVFSSPLSYNSQVTVPLSIFLAEGDEEILILEMGMSEPGQIQTLTHIAPPDIAMLTALELQHTTHFPTGLSGICQEKSAIFSHAKTRLGIMNMDHAYANEIKAIGICPKKTFSLNNKFADLFGEPTTRGLKVYALSEGAYEVPLQLPVKAYYRNFLAAALAARELEVPWKTIQASSAYLELPPNRFECIKKGDITFINDAYNANPEAITCALDAFPVPKPPGRKIAILSEMNDLGIFSEMGHHAVAEKTLECVDILMCLGPRCGVIQTLWQKNQRTCEIFETKESLVTALKKIVRPHDVVLLKGARAYALEEILDHF